MLVVHLGQTKISELKGHTKLKVKLKYNPLNAVNQFSQLKQTYNYIDFNYFLKIILLCCIIDKHIQYLSNNEITKIQGHFDNVILVMLFVFFWKYECVKKCVKIHVMLFKH